MKTRKPRIYTRIILAFGLLMTALSSQSSTVLRINQTAHPLDTFAVNALRVAIKNMPGDYTLEIGDMDITQARAVEMLKNDEMDIIWLATNSDVESQLRAVYFPLLKGLLGHRVAIIHPSMQGTFSQVRTYDDLRSVKFGQGQGWPDVEILRSNGLQVVTTSKYDNLFYMTEGGRFDGFPRGLLEPWVELAAHPDLNLTVEQSIVLVYRLAFYLFVTKDNEALGKALHEGLDIALANGDYDDFFYNTTLVKDAISRSNLTNRQVFTLKNPFLTKETPPDDSGYWLDINKIR